MPVKKIKIKRKINMRKIIVALSLAFVFLSCSNSFDNNCFIVEKIYSHGKFFSSYCIVRNCSESEKFLRKNHIEIVDSALKFNIGDTIKFSK